MTPCLFHGVFPGPFPTLVYWPVFKRNLLQTPGVLCVAFFSLLFCPLNMSCLGVSGFSADSSTRAVCQHPLTAAAWKLSPPHVFPTSQGLLSFNAPFLFFFFLGMRISFHLGQKQEKKKSCVLYYFFLRLRKTQQVCLEAEMVSMNQLSLNLPGIGKSLRENW